MAILEVILETARDNLVITVLTLGFSLFAAHCIYCILFHPIAHIPGPLLPKITSLWLYYHSYIGDEASIIYALHKQYGPFLRVAPNNVDISDADAIQSIYVTGGGFPKAACYRNFDIDGHATIFSAVDYTHRTLRARAIVPMFSTASIRSNSEALYDCVNRMILRMQSEAGTGRPVNVLNLTRSLAVDIVSTHLFQLNYNGTEEKADRLSASPFVDAFVAVGRFFYVPTWAFIWLEWIMDKLMPNERAHKSMKVVEKFVDNLVERATKESLNYPGRLMEVGLPRTEVVSQCKDLIFAGTDSSGMNMATICRYLVMNPERLEILHQELERNEQSETPIEIQALPYLMATVKEALRLSMANPTRLPRIVPSNGWTFKSTYFPPGTDVGCAAFQLHLDPITFAHPEAFIPERWLDENAEVKERMNKCWFVFGAGSRGCLARNLAMAELCIGTEKIVKSRVLEGAKVCQEKIEIYEWFNSSVKEEKIELVWPGALNSN